MFTKNYYALMSGIAGQYSTTSGSSTYYMYGVKNTETNFVHSAGNAYDTVYAPFSGSTSNWTQLISNTGYLYNSANLSGIPELSSTGTAGMTSSRMFINVTTKNTPIDPDDYAIIATGNINSYCSVSRNNNRIFISINNSSGSSISFNTVQVYSPAGYTYSTNYVGTWTFLWAEFQIPTVTIAPGENYTYVIKKEMDD